MPSVNKVILLGNLGADPEQRNLPSGALVCNIRVATTRSWKNKDSGEKMEETEWSSIVFFDRLAEIAGQYLQKGAPVYVEGRLKTRKWQDKEGTDRYTTEIVAESMQLLGSRDQAGGGQGGGGGQAPQQRSQAAATGTSDQAGRQQQSSAQQQRSGYGGGANSQPRQAPAQRGGGGGGHGFDDMDSDIPFLVNVNDVSIAPSKVRRLSRSNF